MKKILIMLLVSLSLVGCGKTDKMLDVALLDYQGKETQKYYGNLWKKNVTRADMNEFEDTGCPLIAKEMTLRKEFVNAVEQQFEVLRVGTGKPFTEAMHEPDFEAKYEKVQEKADMYGALGEEKKKEADMTLYAYNEYKNNVKNRLMSKGLSEKDSEELFNITKSIAMLSCPEFEEMRNP